MQFAGIHFENAALSDQPQTFTWQSGEFVRRVSRVAWTNVEIVQLLGRGGYHGSVRAYVADTATLDALRALADAGTLDTLSGVLTPEGVKSYANVRLDTVGQEQWVPWSDPPVLLCTLAFWRQGA